MSEKSGPQFSLGTILEGRHNRDAIHIAVMAVVANDRLMPGTPINFVEGSKDKVDWSANPIGIVDPFLQTPVAGGQQFWMMLLPNTITSLRHEWTHPEIDGEADLLQSKRWMEAFANQYGWTGDRMVHAGTEWVEHENYACDGGTFEGESVPDEFWDHWEALTGKKVKSSQRESFFTCSC